MAKHTAMRTVLLGSLFFAGLSVAEAQKIRVLDAEKGTPLQGVLIASHHHRTGTNFEGYATLPDDLSPTDSITLSFVGYETQVHTLTSLSGLTPPWVVRLKFATENLSGVSVETTAPVIPVTAVGERIGTAELQRHIDSDLADVLSGTKGISLISSGTNTSIPVIHGMSGNRILIVNNGVHQEYQQWNHHFAPLIDMGSAGEVSVLKGAESIRYGGDALGGVIVVNEAPLPYDSGRPSGSLGTHYSTNGRAYGGSGEVTGAQKVLAYRLQAGYSNSGDHSTARYLLNNTGSRALNLQGTLGWRQAQYGAEVTYSLIHHKEGTFFGAKMGSTDLLKERIELGRPIEVGPFSRSIAYPLHEATHHYVRAKGFLQTPELGRLELLLAYQQDRQNEYHNRRMNRGNIPSVALTLDNIQTDLTWKKAYRTHWSSEAGLHGAYTNNHNRPGTGVVPLIPNYVELTAGLYGIQKYHGTNWGAELGVRLDGLYLNASGIDAYSKHYGGIRRYTNATYSLGAHYHLSDRLDLRSQLGTAWRAPHVGELWSDGVDASGGIYLRGDSTMHTERSTKWITALTYRTEALELSAEGYFQWIDGYIYKEPSGEFFTVVSGAYPLFRYHQTAATMHGADLSLRWSPLPYLSYRALTGMIWATERTTGRYLPYIPPFRFTQELEVSLPFHPKSYFTIEHRYTAQQKRFDPETDLIPYTPPAYHLWGCSVGTELTLPGKQRLELLLQAENLFNKEYKEYTNLARYYAHEAGRDIKIALRYHF